VTIGIIDVASEIPRSGVNNYEQANRFGKDIQFLEHRIGANFLPRMSPESDTSDLVVNAVQRLIENSPRLEVSMIDVLVVVTQNPDGSGLPHCSAIAQEKLDLSRKTAAFDISLGCSGYVYGLYAISGFMKQAGLTNGVLVTADPYSKIVDPEDANTALLFGDAATATWVGQDGNWNLGPSKFLTDGSGAGYLKNNNGSLFMDGRRVMSFAKNFVCAQIKELLEEQGMTEDDVDLFLIHQGSRAVVETIAEQFKVDPAKFPIELQLTGNTVSSSIPLLLESRLRDSSLQKIVISGFGVGLSAASAILYHTE